MSKDTKAVIDPTTLSVVWNRLNIINLEMGERIIRASQSYVMALGRDLGPVLLDARARFVSQISHVPPTHAFTAEIAAKAFLEKFAGKIYPGDCFLANDGHIIRSGHLPDWVFISPVFWHDELVAYAHCRAHMMDTGGSFSGGYFPRAYDCIAEGLNIPPVKIIEKGKENKELMELIFRNVRNSAGVRSDSMLVYGAMMRTEKDIIELIDRYGLETIKGCWDEMTRVTEDAMRRQIREIPDGVYYGETACDWDGTTPDKPVWIRVKLTVKGDELTFDFSESDDQVDFINTPLGTTYSYVYHAIFLTMDPNIPRNHGSMVPVTIIAPPGKVVNPTYPHTYGSCAVAVGIEIVEVCLEALGKALPKKAPAAWSRPFNTYMVGRDPRPDMTLDPRTGATREYSGHPFVTGGGSGAVYGFDGWEAMGSPAGAGLIVRTPIERAEMFFPHCWRRIELAQDSEGPGEYTGCTGTLVENECLTEKGYQALVMTGDADGQVIARKGQAGAPNASLSEMYIYRARTGQKEPFHTMDIAHLGHGDVIVTRTAGGSGWGNPLDRDIARVREDVREGVVSAQRAKDVYGVVIDPGTAVVDKAATEKLRAARKQESKGGKPG
ncbi:MAG: hydantoinase B/oxoprolinase family protein [Chloroflexota bacterium]